MKFAHYEAFEMAGKIVDKEMESFKRLMEADTMTQCNGMNCGTTDGNHSPECRAEHAAAVAGGRFVKFECAARKQGSVGGNMPADCDWPGCGCDPHASKVIAALEESGMLATTSRAAVNGIPATPRHDEGAIARCSYCGRYSLDPKTLSDRQPQCECGKKYGWSGSFKKPGLDAKWSGTIPSAPAVDAPARDEREAFEHQERASNLERDDEGDYLNPCVQSAWEGWQARAALSAKSEAAAGEPVTWIAHWAGSNPYKGWSIRCGRDEVVWLGEDVSSEDVEAIVQAHNKCFDCEGSGCVMNCSGLNTAAQDDAAAEPIYQARQHSDEEGRWDDVQTATYSACAEQPQFYETRILYTAPPAASKGD